MKPTKDVQADKPNFNIPIQKVGVREIKIPFTLLVKGGGKFNTIAKVSSYCDLVEDVKGINMSRISRGINEVLHSGDSDGFNNMKVFADKLQKMHNTDNIFVKAVFDYILKDTTPMSELISYEPIKVTFETVLIRNILKNFMTIELVGMSLCPCSKEMSMLMNNVTDTEAKELALLSPGLLDKVSNAGFGAHNQKSYVTVKVEIKNKENGDLFYIEDLVDLINSSYSCRTWSTLKREDEKYVTEVSYMGAYIDENKNFVKSDEGNAAMFVEDIARMIANQLNSVLDDRINDYAIIVNNQESIHSQDIMATAVLTCGRHLS